MPQDQPLLLVLGNAEHLIEACATWAQQLRVAPRLRMSGACSGAVRAITEAGDQMQLVASLGLPESVAAAEFSVRRDCGFCGAAAAGDVAVWSSDLSSCAACSGAAYFGAESRHMVAIPLHHRGQVLGVYNLFFAQGRGPGSEVLAVLQSVGELLGLAMNNARLERQHLRAAVTNERQSMAAEVHDSIAQTLAFVKLRMPLLQEAIVSQDQEAALRYAADVRRAVTDAHGGVRELITNFRAPVDPLGLQHALQSSIDEFERSTGIELAFHDRAPGLVLTTLQETQLFRIVQEALTNIAKHAGARHTWLSIERQVEGVEIVVEDDGRGGLHAAPDTAGAAHYGIEIMRQRAARLGGQLEIGQREGGGTRVLVRVPVAAELRATP